MAVDEYLLVDLAEYCEDIECWKSELVCAVGNPDFYKSSVLCKDREYLEECFENMQLAQTNLALLFKKNRLDLVTNCDYALVDRIEKALKKPGFS